MMTALSSLLMFVVILLAASTSAAVMPTSSDQATAPATTAAEAADVAGAVGAVEGTPVLSSSAPGASKLNDLGPGVWMPEQASTVAAGVDFVFDVITWICIFFFVGIVIVMAWFMFRYNHTRSPKATSSVTHNTPLELTWTIIPLLLVIGIFYVGLQGYLNLRVPPAGAYQVRVTAQKWSWLFEHSNGASEANILRVPVGQPVQLLMQSKDVLHACFIPSFRVKQDVVPGRISTLWFEATRVGEFELYCAEYCGKDHSMMRAKVIVLPEDEFRSSLQAEADLHKKLPDSALAEYAVSKLYPRCASCHSLDGKSGTGPSWRETAELWGAERVMTDGTRVMVDENYVRDSILNPAAHVVANFTNAMPTFKGQLDDRQVWALILAIRNLEHFDNAGKLKPGATVDWSSPAGAGGSGNGEEGGGFPGSRTEDGEAGATGTGGEG